MAKVVSPQGHKYYDVAYVGHSLVTCDTLRPVTNPWPFVTMDMIRVGGARVDQFFEYPQFERVLKPGYHLVIVMLGGNDISEKTDVKKLVTDLLAIHQAIESYGATCVLCTIEKREYPPNHPHFVDPQVYNKIMNAVNKKLCKTLKGKIILLGGLTYPLDVRTMDQIHPNWEGRKRIWAKVHKAIKFHYDQWAASF